MENVNSSHLKKINIIKNKLSLNTIEFFSANWITNIQKQSIIRYGDEIVLLRRGYNLFGFKNGILTYLRTFDACYEDYSVEIQKFIKKLYDDCEYDYFFMMTHDDAANKTNVNILQNYLIFLGCSELNKLKFRGSYLLVYNLKKKQISFELCDNKFPIHEWFEIINHDQDNYFLQNLGMPVYLIVYNYLYFTKNSIEQLKKYTRNIHIIDNNSTYDKLIEYYNNEYEFFLDKMELNYGHLVWNTHMLWQLPRYFIISDPDLEYNKNLPTNFIQILKDLSEEHKKGKVGFALDISQPELFYKEKNYTNGLSIEDWEQRFWLKRLDNPDYELYDANIDTTFCLVNREYKQANEKKEANDGIRIAGNFTCKHIPWYEGWNKLLANDEWEFYKKNNVSSSLLKAIEYMQKTTQNQATVLTHETNSMIVNLSNIVSKLSHNSNLINFETSEIIKNMCACVNLLDLNRKILYDTIQKNKNI